MSQTTRNPPSTSHVAASRAFCAAKMLSASAISPTITTIVQQNQASSHPLPLSTIAKHITRFLFGESPLPPFLQQYGHLLLVFTGGAAVASSLYNFFQAYRQNRAKVQLAVYHVVRMVDSLPDWHNLLQTPQKLIAQMDEEVTRMIDLHLTKSEAESAMAELKRKLWAVVDENLEMEKRRRKDSAIVAEDEIAVPGQFSQAEENQTPDQYELSRIIDALPSTPPVEYDMQAQLQQEEDEFDVSMLDVDDQSADQDPSPCSVRDTYTSPAQMPLPPSSQAHSPHTSPSQQPSSTQGYSTYEYPSSSDSDEGPLTPTPAPRPRNPTPQSARSGYGFSYDDEEFNSSASTSSSEKTSPTEQQYPQRPVTNKPMSMLQTAVLRAFDSNAPGNRPYRSPVLPRPTVTKPRSTIKIDPPPVSITTKSRGKQAGTQLTFIHEGNSPQESPCSTAAEYRVAESRPFYRSVMKAREERRLMKKLLKPEADIEQMKPEKIESPTPIGDEEMGFDVEWPAPILRYSGSEKSVSLKGSISSSSEQARSAPLASINSPPTAQIISPALPSPLSDAHTPEVSSPILDSACSPPVIEAQTPMFAITSPCQDFVSPETPQTPTPAGTPPRAIVSSSSGELVETSPKANTPSRPKKKRGRPSKVVSEPQTPCRVQTPMVRKSTRKSAFKGMYGK